MSPFLLLIPFFAAIFSPAAAASESFSAYQILQSYNFPVGLLPQGATGYDFDRSSGKFSVYFNNTCSFSIQKSYQLRYQPTIAGRISDRRLRDLRGISVKVLFLWVNIVEVDRSGDNLDFSVGIASADFPANNFDQSPKCGCGMDCGDRGDGDESRIKLRGSF